MRFPPSFIERLRSHFLISEVIGRRIAIKKHGREFMGLCPFHNEKTPSFTVNDEKNFYHCFGCAAHGDAIGFVMSYEKLSYPEAIEKLAREAGIPLPEPTPEERKKFESEKTLLGVLTAAATWFEQQLVGAGGITARGYIEKRGLTPETVRLFGIGYAPDGRDGLYKHLLAAGFTRALMAEAGLIIVPDDGNPYDRFRSRVMFPIRNASGKTVAFGGRLIGGSDATKHLPKYLNSPETPLFKKGEMLYNLDLAKRTAREKSIAVVMEGYMDVVSSHQSGIHYAVATLGTAVTPTHLRLLWQLCKEPVMCLDGDEAGKRAMDRAAEVALPLLAPGQGLRFAVLPKGDDPDSYVQKNGRASFEQLLAAPRRLSLALWNDLLERHKPQSPEGFSALEQACKKLTAGIGDATVRKQFEREFGNRLWEERRVRKPKTVTRSAHVAQMAAEPQTAALDKLASRMLALIVSFPQMLEKSQVEETLSDLDPKSMSLFILRETLLAAESADIENAETLARYLGRTLPDGLPELAAPARQVPSLEEAVRLWNDTATAYRIANLELELKTLQEQDMDEASYGRLVEIKQQIHQAQAARTFAPPETDVA